MNEKRKIDRGRAAASQKLSPLPLPLNRSLSNRDTAAAAPISAFPGYCGRRRRQRCFDDTFFISPLSLIFFPTPSLRPRKKAAQGSKTFFTRMQWPHFEKTSDVPNVRCCGFFKRYQKSDWSLRLYRKIFVKFYFGNRVKYIQILLEYPFPIFEITFSNIFERKLDLDFCQCYS